MQLFHLVIYALAFWNSIQVTAAMPAPLSVKAIQSNTILERTTPYFPEYPPSCPKCQVDFENINSCADASAALADPQSIILNPVAFYDLIKCACTDTFQSTFPQCVDCFIQTNQTLVIQMDIIPGSSELPTVITGMRQVCALSSTLLGGVASNSQVASSTSSAPTGLATSAAVRSMMRPLETYILTCLTGAIFAINL
ncbi:hypothetical protein B0J17DRAFT_765668 [Rhizoctonia solani]|nr:hypothetical protein B0J17DRAFT_765668 [Rhizoctonia solani]